MNNITSKIIKTFAVLSCGLVLASCGSSDKKEEETKVPETFHIEKEEFTQFDPVRGVKAIDSLGKLSIVTDASFGYCMKLVKEGERYIANFKLSTEKMLAYAFTDYDNNIISSYNSFSDNYSSKEYYRCSLTVPHKATCMYINCDASYLNSFDLIKLKITELSTKQLSRYNNIDKQSFTVACNNTGEFDYGNDTYTDVEYKDHWTKMRNSNPTDFFGFEDLRSTYLDGSETSTLLGNGDAYWNQLRSFGSFFALSTNYEPISTAIVPLPFSVNGKTSKRFIAFRSTYLINKKLTAIYLVHLIAEGHISSTLKDENNKSVNYLSQQLRQNQFLTLMKDMKAYDEAIVMGDFNAQDTKEYKTWVNEGFNIANGSEEFGSHITLIRDPEGKDKDKPSVPADNIITTKGINIKSFSLLDTYNLNTDHRPVISTLEFANKVKEEAKGKQGRKFNCTSYTTPFELHSEAQNEFFNNTFSGDNPTTLDENIKGLEEFSRPKPVNLKWDATGCEKGYKILVSENGDLSNAWTYESSTNEIDIYNLKTGTTYYYQVIENVKDNYGISNIGTFKTKEGIRNLYIDGVTNVRDMGGFYVGENNKVIKPGLIFRGGRLNNSYPYGSGSFTHNFDKKDATAVVYEREITEKGIEEFRRLGIQNEIDYRNPDGDGYPGKKADSVYIENVSGVYYNQFAMTASDPLKTSDNKLAVKNAFELMSNKNNYPIYMHCNIGTNRTGTLAILLQGLCGVSEEDILKDYMFSNFGTICVGERQYDKKPEPRAETKDITDPNEVIDRIRKASGSTISEKTISVLIQAGLDRPTCEKVKNILLGN